MDAVVENDKGAKQSPREVAWAREAQQSGKPVDGLVETMNKGGYEVRVRDLKGFCPFSQMDTRFFDESQREQFLGQMHKFKVLEYDPRGNRLVLSRKALLENTSPDLLAKMKEAAAQGAVVAGTVMKVESFGAFIDLGGVEGLLHVSEFSHSRSAEHTPKVGDTVQVKIIQAKEDAQGKLRISLSLKAAEQDPWAEDLAIKVGDHLTGKVLKVEAFGAFVELKPGIEGLIHVSEISLGSVSNPAHVLKPGDEVKVKVTKMEAGRRRIGLSIKEAILEEKVRAEVGELAPRKASTGEAYVVVVETLRSNGLFVRIPEIGWDVSGFVPADELSAERHVELKAEYPVGKVFKAELLSVEQKGKMRLSVKAMVETTAQNEYRDYLKRQNAGGSSKTTLGDLLNKALQGKQGKASAKQ